MSRNIDDVIKEVVKSSKELHKVDDKLSKEIGSIEKEILTLKKDIKGLASKIDEILNILNTLTIFIEDAEQIIQDEDAEDDYQSNEGWLPEVNNWEENYESDDEDD